MSEQERHEQEPMDQNPDLDVEVADEDAVEVTGGVGSDFIEKRHRTA